jgi:hypothetical protein
VAAAVIATAAAGLTFGDPAVRSSFDGDALAALVSAGATGIIGRLALALGRRGRDMAGWAALAAGRGVAGEESGAVAGLWQTRRKRCEAADERQGALHCSAVAAADTAPVSGRSHDAEHILCAQSSIATAHAHSSLLRLLLAARRWPVTAWQSGQLPLPVHSGRRTRSAGAATSTSAQPERSSTGGRERCQTAVAQHDDDEPSQTSPAPKPRSHKPNERRYEVRNDWKSFIINS